MNTIKKKSLNYGNITMSKLLKILKWSFLIGIVAAVVLLGRRWIQNPIGTYPYPYTLNFTPELPYAEIDQAHVLIVGDRLAKKLPERLAPILKELSANLREPLKLVDISEEGEGLFRTIHKLRSIKKLPPVVIYHGGADEFFEQRVDARNRKLLLTNIQRYENPKLNSLLHAFPIVGRLLYAPLKYFEMKPKIVKDERYIETFEKQVMIELVFKLYQIEILEFVKFIKEQNSRFIVITPPINLELSPTETCSNSDSPTLSEELKKTEEMINRGDFKDAYQRIGELQSMSIANAKSYYLLGMAMKGIGRISDARGILYRATAFDCVQDRPTLIGYKILLENIERESIPIIEFNRIVNNSFGNNVLFFDHWTPQGVYYDELTQELKGELKKALNL